MVKTWSFQLLIESTRTLASRAFAPLSQKTISRRTVPNQLIRDVNLEHKQLIPIRNETKTKIPRDEQHEYFKFAKRNNNFSGYRYE